MDPQMTQLEERRLSSPLLSSPPSSELIMDSAEFHAAVYSVVRLVPFGKATSYGHVAKLIGLPRHARHVGQALKFLDAGTDIPWQRVVSSSGKISSRGPGTTGAQRQREALGQEGIDVRVTRDGEFAVNWAECGWFPEHVDFGANNEGAVLQTEEARDGDAEDLNEVQNDGQQQ